jgi:amino acid transporter
VLAAAKTHASASFVFTDWENATGWSGGVAFLTGMLNGAFAIGTPDSVTHMAEELPHPRKDLPRAIAAQIGLGALSKSHSFPLRNLNFILVMFSGIRLCGCAHVRHHRP